MPSVVSGAEWQRIIQEQENKKLAKTTEAELKRKIKIEKLDEIRIKNLPASRAHSHCALRSQI